MKAFSLLTLSLFLGVVFCLILVNVGILTLHMEGSGKGQGASVTRSAERVPMPPALPVDGGAALPENHGTQSVAFKTDEDGEAGFPEGRSVHAKALAFLAAFSKDADADIEGRYVAYLTGDLGLTEAEAEKMVRMSFWKSFVTLQQEWAQDQGEQLKAAFDREKKLKTAGFRAMGLTLMEGELLEAAVRYRELSTRLSQPKEKGGA